MDESTPLIRDHVQDAKDARAKRALMMATLFTLAFMVVEVIGGYWAGSLAIMTDAAHLLADVGGMLLSLAAMTIASRPADSKFSFGYRRAEILGALASVLLIWSLVGVLVYEGVQRLVDDINRKGDPVDGKTMTIIGVAGLLVNVIDALILYHGDAPHGHGHDGGDHGHSHASSSVNDDHGHAHGKKGEDEHGHGHGHGHGHDEGNANVQAALIHVLGDCLQSVGVIAASLVIWIGNWKHYGMPAKKGSIYNIADPCATLVFGVITLMTTIKLLKSIIDVLMHRVPGSINYDAVNSSLDEIVGVREVHHLHIWSITFGRVSLSAHITAPHEHHLRILAEANEVCRQNGIAHTTIQMDDPAVVCSMK